MCVGTTPDIVNSRGDALGESLTGRKGVSITDPAKAIQNTQHVDPVTAAKMFTNWLTGGGLPSKIDPTKIFSEATIMHGVNEKASAGQGAAGLFGFGNMIGDLNSKAPMQKNVPYSVPPIPKLVGGK